jgi:hypothetical protein
MSAFPDDGIPVAAALALHEVERLMHVCAELSPDDTSTGRRCTADEVYEEA